MDIKSKFAGPGEKVKEVRHAGSAGEALMEPSPTLGPEEESG